MTFDDGTVLTRFTTREL